MKEGIRELRQEEESGRAIRTRRERKGAVSEASKESQREGKGSLSFVPHRLHVAWYFILCCGQNAPR